LHDPFPRYAARSQPVVLPPHRYVNSCLLGWLRPWYLTQFTSSHIGFRYVIPLPAPPVPLLPPIVSRASSHVFITEQIPYFQANPWESRLAAIKIYFEPHPIVCYRCFISSSLRRDLPATTATSSHGVAFSSPIQICEFDYFSNSRSGGVAGSLFSLNPFLNIFVQALPVGPQESCFPPYPLRCRR